jgi:hypothetical protein
MFIAFDIDHKHAVNTTHIEWARTLPREPGQIGGPINTTIEAPQIGTTVRLMVNPQFAAFLRANSSIPFREE